MQFEPMATEILTAEMKKDIDLNRSKFMIKKTTLNPFDNINLNEGPVSPLKSSESNNSGSDLKK